MKNKQSCFKEELNPQDRIKVKPVELRIKEFSKISNFGKYIPTYSLGLGGRNGKK